MRGALLEAHVIVDPLGADAVETGGDFGDLTEDLVDPLRDRGHQVGVDPGAA